MRKRYGVILGVIGYIVFFFCMEGWGADWQLLEKLEGTKFYYDKKDVTQSPQKIVKVWIRQVYTEKDKDMMNLLGLRYENLSYSVNSLEFRCGARLTRFLTMTYFSEDEDLLGLQGPSDKWEPIPLNSMFDALYKIVCK